MRKRKFADYVYRNHDDSMRVRVFRRDNGHWDYDAFLANGDIKTFSTDAGDDFRTKRDALADARHWYGKLTAIVVEGFVDNAWFVKQYERRRAREAARRARRGGHPGPFGAPGSGPL